MDVSIAPSILNADPQQMLLVNFMTRLLYPGEIHTEWRQGLLGSRFGRLDKRKFFLYRESNPDIARSTALFMFLFITGETLYVT